MTWRLFWFLWLAWMAGVCGGSLGTMWYLYQQLKTDRRYVRGRVPLVCAQCGYDPSPSTLLHSVVTDRPGHPVSARCMLVGCRDWPRTEPQN